MRAEGYGIFEPMKKEPILFLFFLFFLLTATPAFADSPLHPEILPKAAKQGEVCLVRVAGPKNLKYLEGEFQRVKISMNPDSAGKAYEGLLAVDMDMKPAKYQVKVRGRIKAGRPLPALPPWRSKRSLSKPKPSLFRPRWSIWTRRPWNG